MRHILELLWLIPALPLVAAGMLALFPAGWRKAAGAVAVSFVAGSFGLTCLAFTAALNGLEGPFNFKWFQAGAIWVEIGWILNPLTAVMLVMVAFISLLIFIYSLSYMADDEDFTRFFCFLSIFAASMLGVVIANSLLLLFICWELVGLASYLLIGFWYRKPEAAAAAKKAFITTRLGDLAFLLGMVWLYSRTGTLLLYNAGEGCLEQKALLLLRLQSIGPLALTTVIGLMIFAGAIGKSGQIPLHVWLPDAMEGPTPVSALIHAATMVAAGVFLVARLYPLFSASPVATLSSPLLPPFSTPIDTPHVLYNMVAGPSAVLKAVTWTGALTALFAASIAVAQTDIKRILAYSTVSQLGFMMAGLGMGGVAVGMFHLITHAFFKALLFLGAGSIIHGSHGEQDIRRMGGLRKAMPVTFAAYAVGMLALSGFPLLFSGFWSKDAILHAARHWEASTLPFWLLLLAALLTGFYMTRQVCYVFFGSSLGKQSAHESPPIMLGPMLALAVFVILLSLVGTPVWPWFEDFIEGHKPVMWEWGSLKNGAALMLMSSVVSIGGILAGALIYGRRKFSEKDWLENRWQEKYRLLANGYFVDEIYRYSLIPAVQWVARTADSLDRKIIARSVDLIGLLWVGLSWASRLMDEFLFNRGFDKSCSGVKTAGRCFAKWGTGGTHLYLRIVAVGILVIALLFVWGWGAE